MRRLAGVLVAASVFCANAQPSDEAAFGADMLRRLQGAMPGAELSSKAGDPLAIVRAKRGDREEAQFNTHRIYGFCRQASAADCEASKAEYVAGIVVEPPKLTPASLRLIVRDAQYVDYVRSLPEAGEGEHGLHERIGSDLYALLASDGEKTTRLVGKKGLKELGLSREQAWTLAARQTQARLPALPTAKQLADGLVGYEGQDYLASLLLDRRVWAGLASQVGPDLFAASVSDRFVLVGMLPNGPDLDRVKALAAQDCAEEQRCVSPHVYRFRDGRWDIAN